jgi:hypothetical protein
MFTNPFPQRKVFSQASSSTSALGDVREPSPTNTKNGAANIYMMEVKDNLQTRDNNYRMPEYVENHKEASKPLTPLKIENIVGETMTHIAKGAFKKDSHNPNVRVVNNYSIMEDLAQAPYEMSTLEVL